MNDPVAKYLPDFAQNGKQDITIRQLLVHYSGLPEDLDLARKWEGKDTAYRMAFAVAPDRSPGSSFCTAILTSWCWERWSSSCRASRLTNMRRSTCLLRSA